MKFASTLCDTSEVKKKDPSHGVMLSSKIFNHFIACTYADIRDEHMPNTFSSSGPFGVLIFLPGLILSNVIVLSEGTGLPDLPVIILSLWTVGYRFIAKLLSIARLIAPILYNVNGLFDLPVPFV